MTARLRHILLLLVAGLPLPALSTQTQAEPPKDNSGYAWPSHYDFFLPYGTKDGGPVYAKPGYKGANLTLTCREATDLLKLKGYQDVEALNCSGSTYRFGASRSSDQLEIELDPRTVDVIPHQQL